MNSLSWLIYLADVLGGANIVLGLLAVAFFAFTALGIVLTMISADSREFNRETRVTAALEHNQRGRELLKVCAPVFVVTLVWAVLCPTKNTVYAIAVSQAGEQILKNEDVQGVSKEALDTLRSWLKDQRKADK